MEKKIDEHATPTWLPECYQRPLENHLMNTLGKQNFKMAGCEK